MNSQQTVQHGRVLLRNTRRLTLALNNKLIIMLLRLAIRKALRRPAPGSIPLSGERARKNNFYATYLEIPSLNWRFLVKEEELKGYAGILWNDQRAGWNATLLMSALVTRPRIRIEHYYRGHQFNYENPLSFLFATAFGRHRLTLLKDRFSQELYNRRQLVRSERMDILRMLTEKALAKPGSLFHPLLLGSELHSRRWFHHPGHEEHKAHLRMVMDSLVESGDLKMKDGNYEVSPKALVTLSDYAKDEQKHYDNVRTARVGNSIAAAVVLVGLAGIAWQVVMWWLGPRG